MEQATFAILVSNAEKALNNASDGTTPLVVFLTTHIAKGATYDTVYVHDDFDVSFDSAAETNILYVALTRARKTCFVNDVVFQAMEKENRK